MQTKHLIPIRPALRQATRQARRNPSLGQIEMNSSGIPTGLCTSSAAPNAKISHDAIDGAATGDLNAVVVQDLWRFVLRRSFIARPNNQKRSQTFPGEVGMDRATDCRGARIVEAWPVQAYPRPPSQGFVA